jgi:hypothetical protein
MPFEISIEKDYLLIQLFGALTGEELLEAGRQLQKREEDDPLIPRVTDVTGIDELKLGFPDIEALANARRVLVFSTPIRSAIVATRPLHIGYARMFQTLNSNPSIDVRIVASREEALAWFKESGHLNPTLP